MLKYTTDACAKTVICQFGILSCIRKKSRITVGQNADNLRRIVAVVVITIDYMYGLFSRLTTVTNIVDHVTGKFFIANVDFSACSASLLTK